MSYPFIPVKKPWNVGDVGATIDNVTIIETYGVLTVGTIKDSNIQDLDASKLYGTLPPLSSGQLTITDTTDSTSTATGSIITAGGAGIAKAVNIGTTLDVAGSTTSDTMKINSVTDSTSTITGSLTTAGGVGIAKAVNIGTTLDVSGAATVNSMQINNYNMPSTQGSVGQVLTVTGASTTAFQDASGGKVESTGLLTGGVLAVGTPTTTFSVSDGTGQIVDSKTYAITPVTWSGLTNITVTDIATQNITFILINSAGAIIQQSTRPTNSERRDNIFVGVVVHVNRTIVDTVNQEQYTSYGATSQLQDLMQAIGFINTSGNLVGPSGATLSITKSSGTMFGVGINYTNDRDNPNLLTLPALDTKTDVFQYRLQNGGNYDPPGAPYLLDVNFYDVAGVRTAIPTNKWSIQRVYSFTSNNLKIQYGQVLHNSLANARDALPTESYVTEPSIAANGMLIGWIIVAQGATDLSDPTEALFLQAGKFGSAGGSSPFAGGADLQTAYDNSNPSPEILTDAKKGALTIQRGSAADTDNILECKNGAGTTTFSVDGAGLVTAGELQAAAGSLSNPSIAFTAYPTNGFYGFSSGVGFTAGGAEKMQISSSGGVLVNSSSSLTMDGNSKIYAATSGTAAAPAVTFTGDTGSGLYRIAANNVGVSIGGVKALDISSTGLAVTGQISATAQPHLRYENGTQTINPLTVTLLQFSTAVDTATDISLSGTGNTRFTINTAGIYHIFAQVYYRSYTSAYEAQIFIKVNNEAYSSAKNVWANVPASSYGVDIPLSFTRKFAVNDYIEVNAFHTAGAAIQTGHTLGTFGDRNVINITKIC